MTVQERIEHTNHIANVLTRDHEMIGYLVARLMAKENKSDFSQLGIAGLESAVSRHRAHVDAHAFLLALNAEAKLNDEV